MRSRSRDGGFILFGAGENFLDFTVFYWYFINYQEKYLCITVQTIVSKQWWAQDHQIWSIDDFLQGLEFPAGSWQICLHLLFDKLLLSSYMYHAYI